MSWSQCRLLEGTRIVPCTSERLADPDAVEAPPLYGVSHTHIEDTAFADLVRRMLPWVGERVDQNSRS